MWQKTKSGRCEVDTIIQPDHGSFTLGWDRLFCQEAVAHCK